MVHRADKESCRARGVARATKVTRFFSTVVGRPTHWLTFFARRSTLVARALEETRIGWTRRGYGWRDATGRDATLRDVLFFTPFLPPPLFQPREERETKGRKAGRVIASSRTTSGFLSREC